MKVGAAQIVNGQIAGIGDLASWLVGEETAGFASLLDLNASEPGLAHRADGIRERQAGRSKEKESKETQPSAPEDLVPGITTNAQCLLLNSPVNTPSWQLESGDAGVAKGGSDSVLSTQLPGVRSNTLTTRAIPSAPGIRNITELPVDHQSMPEENAATMAPVQDRKESIPVPQSSALDSQDVGMAESVAAPTNTGMATAVVESLSVVPRVVGPSAGFVGTGALLAPQAEGTRVGMPVVRGSGGPNRQSESDQSGRNPTSNAGARVGDLLMKGDTGSSTATAQLQGNVDPGSSTAGGRGQGSGGDAHRGSPNAKETVADDHGLRSQVLQDSNSEAFGSGYSVNGHSAPVSLAHPKAVQESAQSSQLKDLTSPQIHDANATRWLGSAMRSDLRVGVQTEAFGRVTIQTSAQGGQLSAQLSLENAKEGASLAAHLPAVEQRIVQQHGLTASVRLINGFEGGSGAGSMGRDHSGSAQGESERRHSDNAMRAEGIRHRSLNQGSGVETALLSGRSSISSRLDVTV